VAATTTTTLSEFIQSAILRAVPNEIAPHLFFPGCACAGAIQLKDLTQKSSITAAHNKYGSLTAYGASEGTDYTTTQALDPTATSVTATEHVVQGVLTDLAAKALTTPNDYEEYMDDVAAEHIAAIMTKYDVDILTLLQSLDAGVTNTGVNLTNAHVLECVAACAAANMPKPWYGFLHTTQYADLVNEAGTPFANAAASGPKANEFYSDYFIGNFYSVNWFVNTNVPTANATADRGGGIISSRAFGATISMMPTMTTERDQSLRGDEILTVMQYGVGEIDGSMGMYLISDA